MRAPDLQTVLGVFLLAISGSSAYAAEISKLTSHTGFETVETMGEDPYPRTGIFGIYEQGTDEFLGYARHVGGVTYELETLVSHRRTFRPGDQIRLLDLADEDTRPPPHAALLQHGDRGVHSRFKRLAYLGVFLGEGQTLDAREFLIDPLVQVQYGVSNRVTLGTSHLTAALGAPNWLTKVQLFKGEVANVTQAANVAYRFNERQWITQLTTVVSLPSSGRTLAHLSLIVTLDSKNLEQTVGDAGSLLQTRLQSVTEVILNDWSRALVGPIYNFDVKAIGGFAQWLWILQYTHLGLGVQTQNLGNFRIDAREGYSPMFTAFWRI
jgi:hypothetical protein